MSLRRNRWTPDLLFEHFNRVLEEKDRAIQEKDSTINTRLESMNEFREEGRDRVRDFMPRKEAEDRLERLTKDIDLLKKSLSDDASRRTGVRGTWTALGAFIGVAASTVVTIAFFLR